MIHIPSEAIKQPLLHADPLGFTFIWRGHFLRGVFPQSVEWVKAFFDSGFIDEVVDKGLFPKTWISDYENEQFGMIIEHEMITPVIYATEWNSAMLKDAALMVLDIAEVAWRYGYNMVDCHKLNVLFRNNRPLYVDLGSFFQKEKGSTGWNPYSSFLRSYYYILKLWTSGAPTLAKRMMAPGLEMSERDYYAFKSIIYRLFPSLIKISHFMREGLCRLAVWGEDEVSRRGNGVKALKVLVNALKLSQSQHFKSLRRKVRRVKIKESTLPLADEDNTKVEALSDIVTTRFQNIETVTFIDNQKGGYYKALFERCHLKRLVSVQQDNSISCREYSQSKTEWNLTSTCFRLLNNSIIVKDHLPESRLASEIVIIPHFSFKKDVFGLHNAIVFIQHCLQYANDALIVGIDDGTQELINRIAEIRKVEFVPCNSSGGVIVIYQKL